MERVATIPSATILAFPIGGRRALRPWADQPTPTAMKPDVIVDCDAWYHQAAMDETKPGGNA